mgnify:CR=1 FL=1
MNYLVGKSLEEAKVWMAEASEIAKHSKCHKKHSGSVIVKDGKIIGKGYSGPALDNESTRTCDDDDKYDYGTKPRFDRTCCIHAEWRALIEALMTSSQKVSGSIMYYCSVDDSGMISKSGKPYCTVCSRLILECGVSEFVLWHEDGICSYRAEEYNELSYSYLRKT